MFRVIDDVSLETCFVFIKKYEKKISKASCHQSDIPLEIAVKLVFPYFILSWVCFQSVCNTTDDSIYMQTISQR